MNTTTLLKELVPVTARGTATRRKLLASAEIEFGTKGFPGASVSSITQRADVGQGTFYLYFHSKEEVFATLVRDIGAEQCRQLEAEAATQESTADAERRVASQLIEFVAKEPGRHRIVSEAQFVDEPVFRETHEKLLARIATQIRPTSRATRNAEGLLRAATLLGASQQVGLTHCQWSRQPVSKTLVDAVITMAAH